MSFKQYLKENYEHTVEEYEAAERALNHLKQALNEFQIADEHKGGHYDDWKYFISKVQELISSDHGESGLEPFLSKLLPRE